MSNKGKSIKVNAIMNVILQISAFVFPLISFPYISRVLLPEGTGKVNMAVSFVAYFVMLAQLGLPTYGIIQCAKVRDNREELSRIFSEIFTLNVLVTIISYMILAILILVIPKLSSEKLLYFVVSLNVLLGTIGIEWLYHAMEEYSYITIRSLVTKVIAVVAMFLLVKSKDDYVIYAAILVLSTGLAYIWNMVKAKEYVDIKASSYANVIKHLKPALVFFAVACTSTIYTNLDNVMLGFMTTDADVGYYSVAIKIKTILVCIITSLGTVLMPRASYSVEMGNEAEFNKVTKKAFNLIAMVAIPTAAYFALFSGECILLIAGDAYGGSVLPMQIIMPTIVFIGFTNILGYEVLVPTGRERQVLYSTIIGAVVDIILNAALIPRYQAVGAAIGTLVAEIAVLIYQASVLRKDIKDIMSETNIFKILVATIVSGIAAYTVKLLGYSNLVTLIISAILFFVIYCLINYKEIDEITHIGRLLSGIRINLGESAFLFVLCLNVVRRIFEISLLTDFSFSDDFLSISLYVMIFVCVLKIAIDILIRGMNKKAMVITVAGYAVLVAIYLASGNMTGIFYWSFICASHNVRFDKIAKSAFVTQLLMITLIFACCAAGILENIQVQQGERLRQCLGFNHYNSASFSVFYCMLTYFYVRRKNVRWIDIIVSVIVWIIVFAFTDSKHPFFISMAFLLIVALIKLILGLQKYNGLYGVIAVVSHPICAIIAFITSLYYSAESQMFQKLDILLTSRLTLGHSMIETEGLSLLGKKIVWLTGEGGYNVIDSAYLHHLIEKGWIFIILVLIAYVAMGIKSIKKRDIMFALVTMAIAMHSTFDTWLLDSGANIFILFMSYIFADTYSDSDFNSAKETEGTKNNFMKNTIIKMWKHKWLVLMCIIVCAGAGAVIGYKNAQKQQTELQAEYEELVKNAQSEYDSKIAEYDNNIKNVNLEVAKAQKQVNSVEDYVNNSVYMKLNPSSIYTHVANIEVTPTEGIDADAIAAKLGNYITSGSVYGDLDEGLDAKHWNDIVSVSVTGNNVSVAVMNVDESTATNCVDALVDAMKDYAGTPLNVISDESYVKTDVNVGYNQNTHRNNYYSYEQNLNNQNKSKVDQENAKAAYEEAGVDAIVKSKVEESKKEYEVSPVKRAMAYAILGVLIGLILSAVLVWIVGIIREDREDKKYSK